ncbi:tRNA epoxyqueuosine(34) reductase QueG [Bacillus massiliigorillae]|uniref:tRNA epoxyqueuosine(34) reductase QueG n=1 Tax=Bacillus massiliigorillae TaxID=1243664 RepID=UPI0003A34F04|nr:tRNA epoxyqueuosine(34) reductase QueG [Bacillus massiliigorillae]
MDYYQLKQDIISYSKEIGIDKIGFTSAAPFRELKDRLIRQQELNYQSGFEEPDLDKRTNPALIFQEPKSIIAIALAYPSKMKEHIQGKKDERRGIFCRASWGVDYHVLVKQKLQLLETYIMDRHPEARVKSMVDTGELVDRAVAERAGIGWSAKNCAIITPEFGSYVYLGEMITNLPLEPDEPIEDQCGTCTKCLDICPTGALVNGGQIDAQRCIAFLTQTKGYIPDEFRKKIGNRLYGCDSCQTICPKNRGIDLHFHEDMEPEPDIAKPLLTPILTMSNRQFKEKFGHVSGSWRGKKPIQRNAIIALAHFKEPSSLDALIDVMRNDPRADMRGMAAWAVGKIGGEIAREALIMAQSKESDEAALGEIEKALSNR